MKLSTKKIYLYTLYIWVFFSTMVNTSIASTITFYYSFFKVLKVLCILLLLLRYMFILKNKGGNYVLKSLMLIVLGIIVYCFSENDSFLFLILFVITMGNIDICETLRMYLKAITISTGFTVVLSVIGLIPMVVTTAERSSTVTRYSMGFSHPNSLSIACFQIVLLLFYLYHNKMKKKQYLLIVLFEYIVYMITYGRTTFILFTVLLIGVVLRRFSSKVRLIAIWEFFVRQGTKILILLGIIGSVYVAKSFSMGENTFSQLNDLLSNRFQWIVAAMKLYPITMFGQKINIVSSSVIYKMTDSAAVIDNSYIYMLLQFGLLPTILIVCLYFKTILVEAKNLNYVFLLCAIAVIILGFAEKTFGILSMNFTLLFIGTYLNNPKGGGRSELQ